MKQAVIWLLVWALLCTFCACAGPDHSLTDPDTGDTTGVETVLQDSLPPEITDRDRALEILGAMTLREKIGQLFIIRPEALDSTWTLDQTPRDSVKDWTPELAAELAQYPAGGIVIFRENIQNPQQLCTLIADLQADSGLPMFMAIDEEGGSVARIGNHPAFSVPKYESMAAIGATGDVQNAYRMGLRIGSYLKEYGLNLNFAPVADVNTNPHNVVIGNRAFGSTPELVSGMVTEALRGFHEAGILGCIKHFPGHGDTHEDTHKGYVSMTKDWETLLECELIPFRENLSHTDLVMVAHITLPNVTTDGLPASLSSELISGKLRQELGYRGLVITDALEMGAIASGYTSAQAAVLTIRAGADLILMPKDYREAFNGILQAVQDGTLTESRIEESVLRILRAKLQAGIIP